MAILDESTQSGGVGATISAAISEQCFDLLDAPVQRLCMDDAPVRPIDTLTRTLTPNPTPNPDPNPHPNPHPHQVPYALSMEKAVVKRGSDVVTAVYGLCNKKY